MRSFAGVTSTTEMQSTMLVDGQVINVIDTIGLFDPELNTDVIGKEIIKCIGLAKDGIHAILLVLSMRARFSEEEATALQILQTLFGPKITNYMIVVFTGGDELEKKDDFLSRGFPKPLQNVLNVCKDRCVIFDNKTKDEDIKMNQRQKLLDLIEVVIQENGGRPYTDSIFKEFKKGEMKFRQQEKDVESLQGHTIQQISDLKDQIYRSHEEQLKRMTEMVESRLRETTKRLEQQLAEEQAARQRAEEKAQADRGKSNEEIAELRKSLEKAQKETEELRKVAESGKCSIL